MSESNLNIEEIDELKQEVNSLLESNRYLKSELEKKEIILRNVLREKEQCINDLKRYKRSNFNLKQQLEDERAYYLKEKEHYCREIVETKKVQKKHNEDQRFEDQRRREIEYLREELRNVKTDLNKSIEANYNLSVKFLRMKSTIYCLRSRFHTEKKEHLNIISDLRNKLERTKGDLDYIISNKFRQVMPPSNKKYLSTVKQNNQLMHDNIYLQTEISRMHNEVQRIKEEKVKFETNLRLPYSHSRSNHKLKKKNDKYVQVDINVKERVDESNEPTVVLEDIKINYKTDITECKRNLYSPHTSSYNLNIAQYPEGIGTIRTQSAPDIFRSSLCYQTDQESDNS